MFRLLSIAAVILAAVATLLLSQPDVEGCAAIGKRDRPEATISIAEESALIVWDPVNKVQHFIRRAAFDTRLPDFAFLVPTPGPDLPKLAELEDGIFNRMETWLLPRIVEKTQIKFDLFLNRIGCGMRMDKAAMEKKDGVRVLHEQKVGGFETAILEADNTEALADWLKTKGYSNDPELQSWLFPYVAAKWRITAFKIMQDPKTGQLATTKPVRMSFKTDRPFFPYREPEGKKDDKAARDKEKDWRPPTSRMLRVFFVSDTRMDGKLGNAAWHAKVPWSDQLTEEQRKQLAQETGVPEADLPAKAWLTTFEDSASPRPGKEEVYFDPAKEPTPIRPPDIIHFKDVWIPLDVAIIGVVILSMVALAVVARLKRKLSA